LDIYVSPLGIAAAPLTVVVSVVISAVVDFDEFFESGF